MAIQVYKSVIGLRMLHLTTTRDNVTHFDLHSHFMINKLIAANKKEEEYKSGVFLLFCNLS